ncbi:MAG: hypothetical protein GY804_14180 [Alphaproteobacteria bacterium]|nr:hypothetical protein [Alphaproteobacteria bacterium]
MFDKKIDFGYRLCKGQNIAIFTLSLAYWTYIFWWKGALDAETIFSQTAIKNYISATLVTINVLTVIYFIIMIEKEAFVNSLRGAPFKRIKYVEKMWVIAKPSIAFVISAIVTSSISYLPARFFACFSVFTLTFSLFFLVSPFMSMLLIKMIEASETSCETKNK